MKTQRFQKMMVNAMVLACLGGSLAGMPVQAAWQAMGIMNLPVWALAVGSDGTLYAGGDFITAGGVTVNRVARWTGSAW